jgi:hypothetical protein
MHLIQLPISLYNMLLLFLVSRKNPLLQLFSILLYILALSKLNFPGLRFLIKDPKGLRFGLRLLWG